MNFVSDIMYVLFALLFWIATTIQAERTTETADQNECLRWPPRCSQYCLNTSGNYSCRCALGYKLAADGQRCQAEGPEARLIFTTPSDITTIGLSSGKSRTIQTNMRKIVDVAYDGVDDKIFLAEAEKHQVWVSDLKLRAKSPLIPRGLQIPEGLDVDYVGRHLYLTDSGLQQVLVCNLDGVLCASLITTEIEKPRAIVVSPQNGQMYWSDWGSKPKIEAGGMDGMSRTVLVSVGIAWPNGLALDYTMRRLYWADAKLDRLESINLDDTTRRVIETTGVQHPFSLAVFEDRVYWSDWQLRCISSANKFTGRRQRRILDSAHKPMGIHIYHSALQRPGKNHCQNSPCSHMCLLNAQGSFTCACPQTMTFRPGQKYECIDDDYTTPYIVAARKTQILKLFPTVVGNWPEEKLELTEDLWNAVAVTYDWESQSLYYSDVSRDEVVKVSLNNTKSSEVIVSKGLQTVDGLAIDWIAKNLYWADSSKGAIQVSPLVGKKYAVTLLDKGLTNPRGLAVAALDGYFYFSDWGTDARIGRCDLAGEDCVTFIYDVGLPNGIFVDQKDGRIYWTDARAGHIESAKLDGTDRKRIISYAVHPYSVAVLDDQVYWTDWKTSFLHFAQKTDGARHEHLLSDTTGLMGITVVSAQEQIKGVTGCTLRQGHCSHLCLSKPGRKFACKCPNGMRLGSNRRQCTVSRTCAKGEVRCDGKCIARSRVCDGRNDCKSGIDESSKRCRAACGKRSFTCDNRKCISKVWVCDSQNDCGDWSDEKSCKKISCPDGALQCDGNRCVSEKLRCNGNEDCTDGTDERNCQCDFRCKKGPCLPALAVCDGRQDCPNGEDEGKQCGYKKIKSCTTKEWRCKNGECISGDWLCNGVKDCEDGSDEDATQCKVDLRCHDGLWMCNKSLPVVECISKSNLCDHRRDCSNGEDEEGCQVESTGCSRNEFACVSDGKCLPMQKVCNYVNDCSDASDEGSSVCHKTLLPPTQRTHRKHGFGRCSENQFMCNDGECLELNLVCNREDNCADSSDEGALCDEACKLNKCSDSQCIPTPTGPICRCHVGTRLVDKFTCTDVDECAEGVHGCAQLCRNTKGSYRCACVDGYIQNGRKCRAAGPVGDLLFSAGHELRHLTLDKGNYSRIATIPGHKIVAFDYDSNSGDVYWSDVRKGTLEVYRESDGKIHQMTNPTFSCFGLAFDWLTGNLYLTDETLQMIVVCNQRETCLSILTQNLAKPRAIALHPLEGLMFWSDWGKNARIERAWMDGNHRELLVGTGLVMPNGITIDYVLQKLYWVDAKLNVIEVVDLTGRNRKIVTSENILHPFSISLFEDSIYWTDWTLHAVIKADKRSGHNRTVIRDGLVKPMDVKIRHPIRQPNGINKCASAGCSHLCLLTPDKAVCLCPTGMKIPPSDGKQCISLSKQPVPSASRAPDGLEIPEFGRGYDSSSTPWSFRKRSPPTSTTTTLSTTTRKSFYFTRSSTQITTSPPQLGSTTTAISTFRRVFQYLFPDVFPPGISRSTTAETTPSSTTSATTSSTAVSTTSSSTPSTVLATSSNTVTTPSLTSRLVSATPSSRLSPVLTTHLPTPLPVGTSQSTTVWRPYWLSHISTSKASQTTKTSTKTPPLRSTQWYYFIMKKPSTKRPYFPKLKQKQLPVRRPYYDPITQAPQPLSTTTQTPRSVSLPDVPPNLPSKPCVSDEELDYGKNDEILLECPTEACFENGTFDERMCHLLEADTLCSCPGGLAGVKCDNQTGVLGSYQLLPESNYAWVAGVLCFLITLTIVIIVTIYCIRRRRRSNGRELISIIRFRNAFLGEDGEQHTTSLVKNSFDNPGFLDQDDENCNRTNEKCVLVMSASDESLDSAFISRRDSFEGMDTMDTRPLTTSDNYDSS